MAQWCFRWELVLPSFRAKEASRSVLLGGPKGGWAKVRSGTGTSRTFGCSTSGSLVATLGSFEQLWAKFLAHLKQQLWTIFVRRGASLARPKVLLTSNNWMTSSPKVRLSGPRVDGELFFGFAGPSVTLAHSFFETIYPAMGKLSWSAALQEPQRLKSFVCSRKLAHANCSTLLFHVL